MAFDRVGGKKPSFSHATLYFNTPLRPSFLIDQAGLIVKQPYAPRSSNPFFHEFL